MARFPFSIGSRKKQTVQPPQNGPPMSKAHKILGSTPLSIDAPSTWDDASSSITSDDRSATTAASYFDSEPRGYEYDDQVIIAKSDEGWGEESDIIPHPLRLNAINYGDPTESGRTDTTAALRKTRSSSTIRSWYDKSKLPLSISQQTSSSAIAKGLPSNVHLDPNSAGAEDIFKAKRKPAKLDLSRTARGQVDAIGNGPDTSSGLDRMLRSPSILSPFSPMSTRSRGSRKIQKKRTKENLQSPTTETPRPGTSGSNRLGFGAPRELPSLYDHYEQMSFRHIMRQSSTPSLRMTEDGVLTLENVAERSHEDPVDEIEAHMRKYPMPETPKTAVFTKQDLQLSPGDGARSVSSRHTKTSKNSKNTDKSLEGADLLQTSVLMLSSDSEDEDDEQGQPVRQSPPSVPMRRPSNAEDRVPPLEECRPKISRDSKPSENRGSRSSKHGKRTSFAASNTYITIPSSDNGRETPAPIDSRSGTPFGSLSQAASSSRTSVMSGFSVNSGMTWQEKSGFGIQEARAITMLPARRPPNMEMGEGQDESSTSNDDDDASRESTLHRNSSADQLTPPLSPTSVDFYIRSAHTSIDGPGTHSRLMAVTHQEQMLLSALRNKQQAMGRTSMSQVSEEDEEERVDVGTEEKAEKMSIEQQEIEDDTWTDDLESPIEGQQQKGHRSKGSQTTITGSTFDFGFPAPPSFKESKAVQNESSTGRRKSSGVLAPIQTNFLLLGGDSIPPSPAGPPPTLALPALPKPKKSLKSSSSRDTVSTHGQQDVPLFFDDTEPSPDLADIQDWELATSPIAETLTPDAMLAIPWPEDKRGQGSSKHGNHSSKTDSQVFLHPNSFSRPKFNKHDLLEEEEQSSDDAGDVPRPDSPISPEAFPAVPTKRTTMGNMARLSAVGPGLLGNAGQAGWWGDDD